MFNFYWYFGLSLKDCDKAELIDGKMESRGGVTDFRSLQFGLKTSSTNTPLKFIVDRCGGNWFAFGSALNSDSKMDLKKITKNK